MNKKIKFLFLGILALVGLFAGVTPAYAQTVTPTCSNAVWSATLYGTVTPNGSSTQAWFEWGTNTSLSYATPHQTFSATSSYSQILTPLAENTTYYWRSMAQNQYGTATGSILSFTTGTCGQNATIPTVSISADNTNISYNNSTNLRWYPSSNATSCSASGGTNGWAGSKSTTSGSIFNTGALTNTTTYYITCSNSAGTSQPAFVTVNVGNQVLTCTDPTATNYGGALPCTYPVLICRDTTAINYGGALPCRYQIPAPTVSLTADNTNVSYNGSTTLRWSSNNATSCSSTGGTNGWSGSKALSGLFSTGALTSSTTFYISCVNSQGQQANDLVTVNVGTQVSTTPTVVLTANPSSIQSGNSSSLSWVSTNATSCNAYWAGNSAINGSALVYPTSTTTYNITCTNSTGESASSSVTVYVNQVQNQPPTVSIYANPASVNYNGSSTIIWNSQNATTCNGTSGTNGWLGTKGTSGTLYTGNLTSTTNFGITCTNNSGQSAYATVTVNVDNYQQTNVQPSVTTNNATNITTSSATLNGFVNGNGVYTTAWFVYGTNTNFGYTTNQNSYGSGYSSYSAPISQLIPNTIYYFRAVAQSSQGLVYGSTLSFNTTADYINNTNNEPTVTLFSDQSNISYNSAATVRWITTNATSCNASGGSIGWAGAKSIGPGSFYTGSLTGSKTYELTCTNGFGSASDRTTVTVRGQVLGTTTTAKPALTSLVLITSSVDRNQPIVPTIDNTRPKPGDEINYTVNYQNIGNASITSLSLRINLPLEVDYISSNPNNPIISGNTLIFNLGTLKANGEGTVTIRTRVRENIPAGTNLNFPATLSYIDPSGMPQSVSANVSAQVWSEPVIPAAAVVVPLGANAFWSGSFLPTSLLGWLILIIVILLLMLLAKYIFTNQSFSKRTTTTSDQPLGGKKTTTTTIQ